MQKIRLLVFSFSAIILWLLVFFSGRVLFLILNYSQLSLHQVFPAFYKGFVVDIGTACYLSFFLILLFLLNELYPSVLIKKIIQGYFIVAIGLEVIIETSGIFLYREWGTTLNYRAFRYLLYPSEASASIEWKTIITVAVISVAVILFWNYIFKKILSANKNSSSKKWSIGLTLLIIPLLILGMRGGFRQIPLSESNSFFSENNFLNQLALNKSWYFFRNVLMNVQREKPFYSYPEYEQPGLIEKLYPESESKQLLNQRKPNVVLIILEGWNTDVVGSLGGISGITPCFDSLAKSGLLFTNMYSSGSRTDQGIVSILSGFPALPDLSIVQDVEKSIKLPSLINDLKKSGYFTSFFYGGELDFCNFRTYLLAQKTDKIIDKYNFSKAERTITWGVPDHFLFMKAGSELHNSKEPFFSVILTQSSHQPFDSPFEITSENPDDAEKYKASVHYIDKAISKFMNQCRNENWFDNTLFIFVADHGNKMPLDREYNDAERFHIPMLFYGNVLDTTLRGTKNLTIANHHDLPATLLSQLGIQHKQYLFSKNILGDSVIPFAYWCTDHSMGWITENQKIGIDLHTAQVFKWTKQPVEEEQKNGVGYVQEILKSYENY